MRSHSLPPSDLPHSSAFRRRAVSETSSAVPPRLQRELKALGLLHTNPATHTLRSRDPTPRSPGPHSPIASPANNTVPMSVNVGKGAMPVRGDRTCPVFDEDDPFSLTRYFADLETLFDKCKIDPDDATPANQAACKALAVRYVSFSLEMSWNSCCCTSDTSNTLYTLKAFYIRNGIAPDVSRRRRII